MPKHSKSKPKLTEAQHASLVPAALERMSLLSMRSRSSLDRTSARCSGGYGFNSCRGLGIFFASLCHVDRSKFHIIFNINEATSKVFAPQATVKGSHEVDILLSITTSWAEETFLWLKETSKSFCLNTTKSWRLQLTNAESETRECLPQDHKFTGMK